MAEFLMHILVCFTCPLFSWRVLHSGLLPGSCPSRAIEPMQHPSSLLTALVLKRGGGCATHPAPEPAVLRGWGMGSWGDLMAEEHCQKRAAVEESDLELAALLSVCFTP